MANAREIQSRMKSIKDTMKITSAMYMVSSSKLQKARKRHKDTEPYFNMLQEGLAKMLAVSPELGTEYFDDRPEKGEDERIAGYLVITADKGLAGAYNHNVIKLAEQKMGEDGPDMLFVVGQLGRHYFEKKDIPIDINFNFTAQNPNMNRARHIAARLLDLFLKGDIDDVYVIYTKMVNSITTQTVCKKVLPLKEERLALKNGMDASDYENVEFIPDAQFVFDKIIPDYTTGFIYGALVESFCSEQNSRMMAMQTATESGEEMLKELSMQYNRARQAAITQEITEVVSGSRKKKK